MSKDSPYLSFGKVDTQKLVNSLHDWEGFLEDIVKAGDEETIKKILKVQWPSIEHVKHVLTDIILKRDAWKLASFMIDYCIDPERIHSKEMALALEKNKIPFDTLSVYLKLGISIDGITEFHSRALQYVRTKEDAKRIISKIAIKDSYIYFNKNIDIIRYVVEELAYNPSIKYLHTLSAEALMYLLEKGLKDTRIYEIYGDLPKEILPILIERNISIVEDTPSCSTIEEAMERNSYTIPKTYDEYVKWEDIEVICRALENNTMEIPKCMLEYAIFLISSGFDLDGEVYSALESINLDFAKKHEKILKGQGIVYLRPVVHKFLL